MDFLQAFPVQKKQSSGVEWKPNETWFPIENIAKADADPNIRGIFLLVDNEISTSVTATEIGNASAYYKTSDGATYTGSFTHTWDKTKDKQCNLGYKTRYIIAYSSTTNIYVNLNNLKSCVYAYICNNAKIESLKGNGVNSNTTLNTILQSVKSDISVTSGLTSIDKYAFLYCISLESLNIPNGVTRIEENSFGSCISLKSIIIPNSVIEIGNSAMYNCTALRQIIIPNSVKIIGDSAFTYSGITSIAIPDSVINIGGYAFNNCISLNSIDILNNSVYISGYYVFSGNSSIIAINIANGLILPTSYINNSTLSVTAITNLANNLGAAPTSRNLILGAGNVALINALGIMGIFTSKNYTIA